MSTALDRYASDGYTKIKGWLQRPVLWALAVVAAEHHARKVAGNICEIGIHHGRFFLALENVARDAETCFAIDIFEDQAKNVDRSGSGNETIFRHNLARYAARPERVEVKHFDSTSFAARRWFADCEPIRLFSVDGGHTVPHVLNDLGLAETSLADGGVVFLDDWFNPAFPSVSEGLMLYLTRGALVPIASVGGKLLLSGVSWHRLWLDAFKTAFRGTLRAKTVRLRGRDFWHVMHS